MALISNVLLMIILATFLNGFMGSEAPRRDGNNGQLMSTTPGSIRTVVLQNDSQQFVNNNNHTCNYCNHTTKNSLRGDNITESDIRFSEVTNLESSSSTPSSSPVSSSSTKILESASSSLPVISPLTRTGPKAGTIQVVLIIPKEEVSSIGPATTLALMDARRDGLLADHAVNLTWKQANCDGKDALGYLVELREELNMSVTFGLPCSHATAYAAKLTSFWDMTTISFASPSSILNDKTMFTTLVRLVPSHDSLAEGLNMFLDYYGVARVMLL